MLNTDDTIIALSSPAGRAPRAIVRLSGPQAISLTTAAFQPAANSAPLAAGRWQALRGTWILAPAATPPADDHSAAPPIRLPATLLLMPGPRSYTRQHVAEIHLPGNPNLVREIIAQLVRHGARPAAPGEFTARAFMAGRLDLTQAEAVMAVINAAGSRSLQAAQHLLRGSLSNPIQHIMDQLRTLLAEVELDIDFSYENLSTAAPADLRRRTLLIRDQIVALGRRATTLGLETSLLRVVLVGRPNVGKSSLFNRLAQQATQQAIVSDIPGTTRDEIRATITLGDTSLVLSDTAGLDEAVATIHHSPPARRLQQAGQSRTAAALARAELLLVIAEAPRLAHNPAAAHDLAQLAANLATPLVLVINKADLAAHGLSAQATAARAVAALRQALRALAANSIQPRSDAHAEPDDSATEPPIVVTSATGGQGLDELKQAIAAALHLGRIDRAGDDVSVSARHRACLDEGAAALARAADISTRHAQPTSADPQHMQHELLALELREALDVLGEITGRTSPQALLQQIFSRFCIGK